MSRCVVCGRIPTEVCCDRCHHVHDEINKPLVDAVDVRVAIHATGNRAQFAKQIGVSLSTVDGWLYEGWHPNADAARAILSILEDNDEAVETGRPPGVRKTHLRPLA